MSDIFVSYHRSDRDKAKTLAEALEKKGWSVWWDRKIPPGKTFSQVIKEALDSAKCIIVLWSQESVKSDWVQNEAAEGNRRKILVPALIEEVEIPFEFRRIQAANFVDWNPASPNAEYDEFVSSIEGIVGEPKIVKTKKDHEPKKEVKPEISQKARDIPTKSQPKKTAQEGYVKMPSDTNWTVIGALVGAAVYFTLNFVVENRLTLTGGVFLSTLGAILGRIFVKRRESKQMT